MNERLLLDMQLTLMEEIQRLQIAFTLLCERGVLSPRDERIISLRWEIKKAENRRRAAAEKNSPRLDEFDRKISELHAALEEAEAAA